MAKYDKLKVQSFISFLLFLLFLTYIPTTNQLSSTSIDFQLFKEEIYDSEEFSIKDNSFLVLFKNTPRNYEADWKHAIEYKYQYFNAYLLQFTNEGEVKAFHNLYEKFILSFNRNSLASADLLEYSLETYKTSDISTKEAIGANKVHENGLTGKGVTIGIVDTGVAFHSDFDDRVLYRNSFVKIKNGYSQDISDPDDVNSHGTHVAGIAAGKTIGIAPEANIVSAKVIHNSGVLGAGNQSSEETTAGLLAAFDYLISKHVDIINISLGQYHNLPDGLRQEIINQISLFHNIVVVVSVGNSGNSYNDSGTLNNPSTSLQCIAVAATESTGTRIWSASSKGPKSDYSMKPDISAPGLNIYGPGLNNIFVRKSGTSMASPVIAGSAALLIEYFNNENIDYTPGTVKAALMKGANPMGYEPFIEGAGFVNISNSINILQNSPKVGDSIDISYLHPQKLPIRPFLSFFPGSKVSFNQTLITSISNSSNIQIPETLDDYITINFEEHFVGGSNLIPITFGIPEGTNPTNVSDNLLIGESPLLLEFQIRNSEKRVLMDESLNLITRHGIATSSLEIYGDLASPITMYSAFTSQLIDNNFLVNPNVKNEFILSDLLKYDVLILLEPFSLKYDKFMDWLSEPDDKFISLSETSRNAIISYIHQGGSLLILSTSNDYISKEKTNELTSNFGIQLIDQDSNGVIDAQIVNNTIIPPSFTEYPFWGTYLSTHTVDNNILAYSGSYATLASYNNSITGGRVIVSGSSSIFDNFGLNSEYYHGDPDHINIAYNLVAWLANSKVKTFEYTEYGTKETPSFIWDFSLVLTFLMFLIIRKKKN